MYKPPERIPFPPAPGLWPSAEQAGASRLFSAISTGRLSLSSRTWVPAMVPWRATEDGYVNDDVIAWYSRFAKGKPGAIVVEATGIRDVPSGPLLRIGDDRFIPGLQKLVDAVRRASSGETKLFIQLIDFLSIRRRPKRDEFLKRFLTITDQYRKVTGGTSDVAVRNALIAMNDIALKSVLTPRDWESLCFGFRERVTDVEKPHIQQLPQTMPTLFKNAALRAQEAGFDGVELHYAHAYTMASFLSALNSRTDGYGGSRENRVRLPLEVYQAVRGALSDNTVVGCRFLAEECIQGGSDVSDSEWFAQKFAEAGMDFLSLSRGGKFEDALQPKPGEAAYPYTGPSGYECMPQHLSDQKGPYGRNSAAGKRIRSSIRQSGHNTPIVVAGGVHGFEMAERMLTDEVADIVASARQSLADPDWWNKMRSGRGNETRVCEFTNYCEGLDQKHKQVTCQLWDREGVKLPNVALSSDGKRRLTAPNWKEPTP